MARYQRPVINYKADDVWAAACAAQRINGAYVKFVPENETGKTNRDLALEFLADPSKITDEDRKQGETVRTYYKGLTFKILQGKALNDFNNTAMVIANRDEITSSYDLAVMISLPSCAERGMARDAVDNRVNGTRGGYVAAVGTKVTTEVEIVRSFYSQQWGVYFNTGINDKDQAVFFAFKEPLTNGDKYKIAGTVKGHRDGQAQLNRVKVIAKV